MEKKNLDSQIFNIIEEIEDIIDTREIKPEAAAADAEFIKACQN